MNIVKIDEDFNLFESGTFEASATHPGSDILIREHEPATSQFHCLSPPPATPSTSSPATAETSDMHPPSETESDVDVCAAFVQKTCGCTKANGKPCSTLFSVEHYIDHRAQASLLTHEQLGLVLLGSIMTSVLDRDSIVDSRHKPAKRRKVSSCHMHNGYKVCKSTYAFLYSVGTKDRRKNIKKHYLEHGMETRVLKNT